MPRQLGAKRLTYVLRHYGAPDSSPQSAPLHCWGLSIKQVLRLVIPCYPLPSLSTHLLATSCKKILDHCSSACPSSFSGGASARGAWFAAYQ